VLEEESPVKGNTIAMFNLNETRRDPRVRRIAGALAGMGNRVIVFGMKSEVGVDHEQLDNFEVVRVSIPQSYNKEDMAEFDKVCGSAANVMWACDPNVMDIRVTASHFRHNCYRALRRLRNYMGSRWRAVSDRRKGAKFNLLQEILAIRSIMLLNLALYRKAENFRPDIVHSNDLDTLLCGYMFKKNHRTTLVFDAHEIYPEQLAAHRRSDTWYEYYSRLERALLPHTDGRLTVCDSLGAYFKNAYNVESFLTILNCPSREMLPPEAILDRRRARRKITYQGAYFEYRGLDEVIHASKSVNNADFVFRGLGPYQSNLKQLAGRLGVEDRVKFEPPVGVSDLVATASECDIGLNPFISVCLNTEYALPNKFFEYMTAGLALASADLIEMRCLTQRYNLGVLYDSKNIKEISDVLNSLVSNQDKLDQYRRNSYEWAQNKFCWEREREKLLVYYGKLLA
jgi:glycosyltransferase involved in cell wall biosynthesis